MTSPYSPVTQHLIHRKLDLTLMITDDGSRRYTVTSRTKPHKSNVNTTEIFHVYILPHGDQQQGRARCISAAGRSTDPGGQESREMKAPVKGSELHVCRTKICVDRVRARHYPRSGAAVTCRRFEVSTPAGVGDATYCRCGAVSGERHHSVIPLIPARQGLNEVPLGSGSEVSPKPRLHQLVL